MAQRPGLRMLSSVDRWLVGVGLLFAASSLAHSAVTMEFERETYFVEPGKSFEVRVFLDGDGNTPGLQKLPEGLFSFGVRVDFDPNAVSLSDVAGIQVPSALDFNGFSSGAARATGQGFAGAKGNIDQSLFRPYADSLLATFQFRDLGGDKPYRLDLKIFRTLGDSEQVFLDGSGAVLDRDVVLSSAQVTAVPEPVNGALLLTGLASLVVSAWHRRRRAPSRMPTTKVEQTAEI